MIENQSGYISPSDIQTILSGTLTRLHVLLTPLCGNLPYGVSPSSADIVAAAETLRLCNTLLLYMRSQSSAHDMKSKFWLDNSYWKTFSLQCNNAATKLRKEYNDDFEAMRQQCKGDAATLLRQKEGEEGEEGDENDGGNDDEEDRKKAIEKFLTVFQSLDETTRNIMILVSKKNRWDDLFGNFAMQQLYGEIATGLYNKFIAGKGLNHIKQMKSLATMYEVLREQADGGMIFYGPEFDKLLYTVCGISYNTSKDSRGRYHRIEERWKEMYGGANAGGSANDRPQRSKEYYDMRAYVREKLSGGGTSRKDAVLPVNFMFKD